MNLRVKENLKGFAIEENNNLNSLLFNSSLSFIKNSGTSTHDFITFLQNLEMLLIKEKLTLNEFRIIMSENKSKQNRAVEYFLNAFNPLTENKDGFLK